jgi:3-dehydrotetronate 4-kinase
MQLGVIADDFTGASDIANTLAKGGLRTTQFLGTPLDNSPVHCEAGVVALKTRSIAARVAIALSLEALDWLKRQGCLQFVFKYCSTFDSTPEGNIGPVGEALAKALDVRGVPVCPAFPTTGRTVYQGYLFVGDRLLNESGMENHPLNPMTDANIRRWLAKQAKDPVGLVPCAIVRRGGEAIANALEQAAGRGERLVIVDAVSDDDLLSIGDACAQAALLTGGSGIALGLPQNFIRRGLANGKSKAFFGVTGPEAIIAGSCSRATLSQIELHRKNHPARAIDVKAVMSGAVSVRDLVKFVQDNRGKAPLIFSSDTPDGVRSAQDTFGREQISQRLERLFADTARELVDQGLRRLVVAGGETSGAVVLALGLKALSIGPEIDPGVPALAAADGRPLALALKSGNFGAPDFFAKALRLLGDAA